ncbi:MAG TPA: hypothetical protein VHC19_25985 [Pirellulales bacterium]|nr:hypothetical protein [Pirellulales bacterium]
MTVEQMKRLFREAAPLDNANRNECRTSENSFFKPELLGRIAAFGGAIAPVAAAKSLCALRCRNGEPG